MQACQWCKARWAKPNKAVQCACEWILSFWVHVCVWHQRLIFLGCQSVIYFSFASPIFFEIINFSFSAFVPKRVDYNLNSTQSVKFMQMRKNCLVLLICNFFFQFGLSVSLRGGEKILLVFATQKKEAKEKERNSKCLTRKKSTHLQMMLFLKL